jgi:hypothetical protein
MKLVRVDGSAVGQEGQRPPGPLRPVDSRGDGQAQAELPPSDAFDLLDPLPGVRGAVRLTHHPVGRDLAVGAHRPVWLGQALADDVPLAGGKAGGGEHVRQAYRPAGSVAPPEPLQPPLAGVSPAALDSDTLLHGAVLRTRRPGAGGVTSTRRPHVVSGRTARPAAGARAPAYPGPSRQVPSAAAGFEPDPRGSQGRGKRRYALVPLHLGYDRMPNT